MTDATTRPRRRGLKIVLALALLLGVLIVLAPKIAGVFAPGIVRGQSGVAVAGRLDVRGVSLSWLGSQRLRGFSLATPDGQSVISGDVTLDRGLLGLMLVGQNLGTITLADASAAIERYADGSTNLDKAIGTSSKPSGSTSGSGSGSSGGEIRLPAGLKASLAVTGLQASFTDKATPTGAVIALRAADLKAVFGVGQPIAIDFSTTTSHARGGATTEGSLVAKIRVDSWSTAAGDLTPDTASIDATITAQRLPVDLADLFSGPLLDGAEPLAVAAGETLDLAVEVKGTMKAARATLSAAMPRVSIRAGVSVADGVLSVTEPITADVRGSVLSGLLPQVREMEQGVAGGKITGAPDVSLRISRLSLPLPTGGTPIDWRSASCEASLGVSQINGSVRVGEGAEQAFRVAPITATLTFESLAQGVRLGASTDLTLDAKPAGKVAIEASAAGLLDAAGAIRAGLPERFEGRVSVEGVATAIAQPFVEMAGLDLATDVGPTLDVSMAAYAVGRQVSAGMPPTHLDLNVTSAHIKAAGTFRVDVESIATRDYGLKIEAASAGRIASRMITPDSGWKLTPAANAGGVVLTLTNLRLPRTSDGSIDFAQSAGTLNVSTAGLRLAKLDEQGRAQPTTVDLLGFTLAAEQAAGADPTLEVRASMAYGSERFEGAVSTRMAGMHAGSIDDVRPVGRVALTSVPTSMAGMFMAPAAADGRDLRALIREAAGPGVSLTITTAQPSPGVFTAALDVESATIRGGTRSHLEKGTLTLRDTALRTQLTSGMARELLRGTADNRVEIAGDGVLQFGVAPLAIPMEGWSPKLDRAGQADMTLTIPAKTTLRNLVLRTDDGSTRRVGEIGVESLRLEASVPLGSILGTGTAKARAKLVAAILAENSARAGDVTLDAEVGLASGKPDGPATATLALAQINTALLDPFAGEGALLSSALGATAGIEIGLRAVPGAEGFDANAAIDATLSLNAPRAKTTTPLALSVRPDKVALSRPGEITIEVDPALANRFLDASAKEGQPQAAAALRLAETAPVKIEVRSLVLPRSALAMLDADVAISAPRLAMHSIERPSGKSPTEKPLTLSGVSITAKTNGPGTARVIDYRVGVDRSELAGAPSATGLALTGHVDRLIDAEGGFDVGGANLSARGDIPVLPTGLIDALAKQEGMLVDVLGPAMSVKLVADRLPLGGLDAPTPPEGPASLNLAASSERASMSVRGEIRNKAFYASEPVRVQLFEVSPSVSARLLTGVPVAQFEKVKGEDAPGLIEAKNLVIPLDSDMTKLSGDIHVAPGEARFSTRSLFAEVLSIAKIRQAGQVGRRLQPLDVSMRAGVVEYSKWIIPLGEFKLETQGKVDLAKGEIDVVTSIPFGALTDEIAGSLNTGLGSALGRNVPLLESLTMVPFRTRGPLAKPSTGPDLKLLGERTLEKLNPIDAIKEGAGRLQDLLRPPPKKDEPAPPK
ncbi:MAG: hypothetical protein HUU18_07170 [Phycisphaerales bacterium]|nr:hypothetical protein [Phycisphaerales bacterium]